MARMIKTRWWAKPFKAVGSFCITEPYQAYSHYGEPILCKLPMLRMRVGPNVYSANYALIIDEVFTPLFTRPHYMTK